jgi:hypothetical protein
VCTHGMVWPEDSRRVEALTKKLSALLNVEEAQPYLELMCRPQDVGKLRNTIFFRAHHWPDHWQSASAWGLYSDQDKRYCSAQLLMRQACFLLA